MTAHNMYDHLGTFKDKRITNISEGGGAAGRALLGDFKAVTSDARSAKNAALQVAKAAQAILAVEDLKEARERTTDPAQRKEIDALIAQLTKVYTIDASADKAADGGVSPGWDRMDRTRRGATGGGGVDPQASLLASWIRQAEDIIACLEEQAAQTPDVYLRESLARIAGQYRLEYGITKKFPVRPRQDFMTQSPERTRASIKDGMDRFEVLVNRTTDPELRAAAEAMIHQVRARYGLLG